MQLCYISLLDNVFLQMAATNPSGAIREDYQRVRQGNTQRVQNCLSPEKPKCPSVFSSCSQLGTNKKSRAALSCYHLSKFPSCCCASLLLRWQHGAHGSPRRPAACSFGVAPASCGPARSSPSEPAAGSTPPAC